MPTIKLAAGIGMMGCALLVAAAPANAALTYVTGSNANVAVTGQTDVPEAPCPDGTSILGGGVYSSGGFDASAIVSSSVGDQSWEGEIDVYQAPVTVRAQAICDSTAPTYADKAKTAAAAERSKIKKGCPSGEHVQSGGFLSNGAFLAGRPIASRPFDDDDANKDRDDGWEVTWDGGNFTATITVLAICSNKPTVVKQDSKMAQPDVQSAIEERCGSGRVVVGGGAKVAVPHTEGLLDSIIPVDGVDPDPVRDDGFRVWVDNNSGEPRKLSVYTICR